MHTMSEGPDLGKILDSHVKAHITILITVMSSIAFVVYFEEVKLMVLGLSSSMSF
jgi:hypothetical protein